MDVQPEQKKIQCKDKSGIVGEVSEFEVSSLGDPKSPLKRGILLQTSMWLSFYYVWDSLTWSLYFVLLQMNTGDIIASFPAFTPLNTGERSLRMRLGKPAGCWQMANLLWMVQVGLSSLLLRLHCPEFLGIV